MKHKRSIVISCIGWVLLCALLFSACTVPEEEATDTQAPAVLKVYLSETAYGYSAVRYLLEEEHRQELETELDCEIELIPYTTDGNSEDIRNLPMDGVILTDDPMEITILANETDLKRLDMQTLWTQEGDSLFGRIGGWQYAYVYTTESENVSQAVLLVLPELLEKAGIKEVSYTPEGVEKMLEDVYQYVRPLAIYGTPNEGSFAPLMGLFDLSPTGGREFFREGVQVCYDKFSDSGKAYLGWLKELYTRELLPKDFLQLSEYSMIDMLAGGRYAMAVMTEEACIAETIRRCEEQGREIAVAELPVSAESQQWNIYRRLLGGVMSDCPTFDAGVSFLRLLHERTEHLEKTESPSAADALKRYPLFSQKSVRTLREDPVDRCTFDANLQYEKLLIDKYVVRDYYSRLVVGDLALDAFDDMADSSLMGLLSRRRTVIEGEKRPDTLEERFTRKVRWELGWE